MINFIKPIDGDCLNIYDVAQGDNPLLRVIIESEKGDGVFINGIKCTKDNNSMYTAQMALNDGVNFITAENTDTGEVAGIKVYYYGNRTGFYRLSIDDSILFLLDINENKDVYQSVFENPFLALLKKAHDLYGAQVHINLFYEYNNLAMRCFQKHRDYFNLSMMTDKFKNEFMHHSDWLHFSFHARSEFPDKPYENTLYNRIDSDIKLVRSEIERFAGCSISPPVTTLHWGASNETGVRALRANGYKLLNGEFDESPDGKSFVSYHYPAEFTRHIRQRDFWKDNNLDIIFSKYDIVLNKFKQTDKMLTELKKIKSNPHTGGFMELLTHEQYYYDDYQSYIPEYSNIVLAACKFLTESGYRGMFFTDLWNLSH